MRGSKASESVSSVKLWVRFPLHFEFVLLLLRDLKKKNIIIVLLIVITLYGLSETTIRSAFLPSFKLPKQSSFWSCQAASMVTAFIASWIVTQYSGPYTFSLSPLFVRVTAVLIFAKGCGGAWKGCLVLVNTPTKVNLGCGREGCPAVCALWSKDIFGVWCTVEVQMGHKERQSQVKFRCVLDFLHCTQSQVLHSMARRIRTVVQDLF